MKKHVLFATLFGALALTSCSKDDETPTETPSPAPTNTTSYPEFDDASGILVGLKTITKQETVPGFPVEIVVGTGVAVFSDTPAGSTFVNAGSVSVNGEALSRQSNNVYLLIPDATNFQGVDFSNGADWNVEGSASVDALNESFSQFPSTPAFSEEYSEVSSGSEFSFSISNAVSGADSVLVTVVGTENTLITKTYVSNAKQFSFSATETATLSKGAGYLQVVPYAFKKVVKGTKNYYLVNESAVSASIEIK